MAGATDAAAVHRRRTIDGTPKTARGRRSVALDAGTVKVLRTWRRAQLE